MLFNEIAPLHHFPHLISDPEQAAQNVIVEFQYRATTSSRGEGSSSSQRSAFAGWSGMPSKRRSPGTTSRDPMRGMKANSKEEETPIVEIDATFGNMLGLSDSQKVSPGANSSWSQRSITSFKILRMLCN